MTSRSREPEDEAETMAPAVAQLRTTPGKYVFTEDGNSEGWIATDSVVSVDR
jgi:hypothetical protein